MQRSTTAPWGARRRAGMARVVSGGLLIPLIVIAGCQSSDRESTASNKKSTPTQVTILPVDGAHNARPDQGVSVDVSNGKIRDVMVTSAGRRIPGEVLGGRTWRSTWALKPAMTYSVVATAVTPEGRTVTAHSSFKTLAPGRTFTASVDMEPGETVGVGMPIMITFNRPIADKAAVERALELTTSVPVVGAWHWFDDKTVHFRPRQYWPRGTKVRLTGHLTGVRAAKGVYGARDLVARFGVGDSFVSVANTRTHRMVLRKNGVRIANWPISTGRPGMDTPNGRYLFMERGNPVIMDSSTFGIPAGSAGYYRQEVFYAVRFSWSGNYTHSAPWSTGDQGYANVSHGCVNLSPARARWIYNRVPRGSPIAVVGSPDTAPLGDGWTHWMMTWDDYLKGSALRRAIAGGPSGSRVVPVKLPARLA